MNYGPAGLAALLYWLIVPLVTISLIGYLIYGNRTKKGKNNTYVAIAVIAIILLLLTTYLLPQFTK